MTPIQPPSPSETKLNAEAQTNALFSGKQRIGKTDLLLDRLGFGSAPLGNLFRQLDDQSARETLETAWNSGFRYFDTAPHYGQGLSERRLGDMLRRHKSDCYVLSTKVGRLLKPAGYAAERHSYHSPMPFDIHYDYSYDGIMRSFEDSLQRLGLDHIDILYMHDIGALTHQEQHQHHFAIAMNSGYKALDSLRSQGAISAIGLGVNEFEVCEQALDFGDWDCFLLAGRYTLLEQLSLASFLPKCETRQCSVIIGGPYNSGILATGTSAKDCYYNYEAAPQDIIAKVKLIEQHCAGADIPLAAAALQFPLAHPAVVSVIPGLSEPDLITKTLALAATEIPDEFWQALKDDGLIDLASPTGLN